MTEIGASVMERDHREPGDRLFGLYAAIVREVNDPQGKGRVRVACAAIAPDYLSDWIQVVQADAGPNYGAYFIPEEKDQVVIAFLNGSTRSPVVMGSLYSDKNQPVMARGADSVPRYFVTPGGHMIVMEDKKRRRIEIVDGTGSNSIVIDTEKNKITISASGDVEIAAGGDLKLSATGSVKVTGTTINLN